MGELNTFPVSYRVQGQRIVIVGGGEEALNKARLAAKTTASVVIISREITADFNGLGEVRARPIQEDDLDGAALVLREQVVDRPDRAAADSRPVAPSPPCLDHDKNHEQETSEADDAL